MAAWPDPGKRAWKENETRRDEFAFGVGAPGDLQRSTRTAYRGSPYANTTIHMYRLAQNIKSYGYLGKTETLPLSKTTAPKLMKAIGNEDYEAMGIELRTDRATNGIVLPGLQNRSTQRENIFKSGNYAPVMTYSNRKK